MKKFNDKSKLEQVFLLMALSICCFCIFAFTGCGGESCETIKCNASNEKGIAVGLSVPGCGGCLTSGEGCNSCLWAQSHKCVAASDFEEVDDGEDTVTVGTRVIGCDTRYYGSGCAGCGQKEKSSYMGCINRQYPDTKTSGCFYGSSDKEEKFIGCNNGCGGCADSDVVGDLQLKVIERKVNIE